MKLSNDPPRVQVAVLVVAGTVFLATVVYPLVVLAIDLIGD